MEKVVGLFAAVLTVWFMIPKRARQKFWLAVFDHFRDDFERVTPTNSAPFTVEDLDSAFRMQDVLERSELLDCVPVAKDMTKAAKAATVTPESVRRDSKEVKPGVFSFKTDTTEKLKKREGIEV